MIASAKKETGLHDLLKDYTSQQLEEQNIICAPNSPILQEALLSYQHFLQQIPLDSTEAQKFLFGNSYGPSPLLTPLEINQFLQLTQPFEQEYGYTARTGLYVTKLIQESYHEGHMNFILNTKNLPPLHYLGYHLVGGPLREGYAHQLYPRKLSLIINGDVGWELGSHSFHVSITVNGNVGRTIGHSSGSLTLRVEGEIDGNYPFGENIYNLELQTSNVETYHKFLKEAERRERKWKIILLDEKPQKQLP